MRCLNCNSNLDLSEEVCPNCNLNISLSLRDYLPLGQILDRGRYRIDYPLGKGGFGITYKGFHTTLEQEVAIKEFYPAEQAIRDRQTTKIIVTEEREEVFTKGMARFLKEAKILSKIDHPNIVKVRDYFTENNTGYIIMNFVSGNTLANFLKQQVKNCLEPSIVKEIIGKLVKALAKIHQEGIYHLDLKPENVLINEQGEIVLIDFGAAKQGMGSQTIQCFTYNYAPPELLHGKTVGVYTDIYQLGVMTYQMLTGKLPPNVIERMCEQGIWEPNELEKPWQNLIETALKLKINERPDDILSWWLNAFEDNTIGKRYHIIKAIGQGGFGKTYLAKDLMLPGKPCCVVKQLNPSSKEPKLLSVARRLFNSEAKALQILGKHDKIPQLFAYFEEEQQFYLVQQYIDGTSLNKKLIAGSPWQEKEVIQMLENCLEILDYIHSQGIIHRDLKPENLICRKQDNKLVLLDFGAVKEIIRGQIPPTIVIGTPGYIPEEQAYGKPRFNSDIYALGVIGIQALTGCNPSELEINENRELAWQKSVEVNPKLIEIITKMTKANFNERYQSAQDVMIDLQDLDRISELGEKPDTVILVSEAEDTNLFDSDTSLPQENTQLSNSETISNNSVLRYRGKEIVKNTQENTQSIDNLTQMLKKRKKKLRYRGTSFN